MRKLGMSSMADLVRCAIRHRLRSPESSARAGDQARGTPTVTSVPVRRKASLSQPPGFLPRSRMLAMPTPIRTRRARAAAPLSLTVILTSAALMASATRVVRLPEWRRTFVSASWTTRYSVSSTDGGSRSRVAAPFSKETWIPERLLKPREPLERHCQASRSRRRWVKDECGRAQLAQRLLAERGAGRREAAGIARGEALDEAREVERERDHRGGRPVVQLARDAATLLVLGGEELARGLLQHEPTAARHPGASAWRSAAASARPRLHVGARPPQVLHQVRFRLGLPVKPPSNHAGGAALLALAALTPSVPSLALAHRETLGDPDGPASVEDRGSRRRPGIGGSAAPHRAKRTATSAPPAATARTSGLRAACWSCRPSSEAAPSTKPRPTRAANSAAGSASSGNATPSCSVAPVIAPAAAIA
jgi:hypothetical protein